MENNNIFDYESLLTRKEVFLVIDTGDKDHPVEIYNPNKAQRTLIINLIVKNLNIGEEELTTNISGDDMLFTLLPELTNVPLRFDVNNPADVERMERIKNDPSDLFLDINGHLNKLVNKQFYRYYDNLKELSAMPEDIREAYIDSLNELNKEKIVVETEKEKRIRELQEELNKLKDKEVGE